MRNQYKELCLLYGPSTAHHMMIDILADKGHSDQDIQIMMFWIGVIS